MEIVDSIKFKSRNTQLGDEQPCSEIVYSGNDTGKTLPARILELAISYQNFYLFFTTDDTPLEEALSIYLLDTDFNVIDYAVIGSIYSTGIFKNAEIISKDKISFDFFGDFKWYVTIYPKFVFKLSLFSYFLLSRKYRYKQHFIITHD